MRTKKELKKELLGVLSTIISINDDLTPNDLAMEGEEYDRWNKARNELVREFDRRSV